ncbi:MAG TPA: calcium/sodium antiporter [Bacteroidales bacterium]|nr:calcium/sodium antiporter [Bacteroidales bacterium]
MTIDIFLLTLGILLLYLGGNFLVKSSVSLANHFNVSPFFIGIVIISFGTSFPELVVSVNAAIKGHPDISLGNIIGSNIANIALALGLTAIVLPIIVKKKTLWIDWLTIFIISGLLILFSLNNKLQRVEGISFLIILILYYTYQIYETRKYRKKINIEKPQYGIYLSIVIIILAFVSLTFGAKWAVESGSSIAKSLGVSERIISLTIIAFGTSLPEIVTSFVAALKKQLDISIANVLGSNIFNIAGVLGITSIITPIRIDYQILHFDYFWMIGFLIILLFMLFVFNKQKISGIEGIILIAVYALYLFLLF